MSWLWSPVRLRASLVSVLFGGAAVRPVKVAIAEALRADPALSNLVPATQIFSVERATLPQLPAVEVIGISSERVDTGPLVRHELSVECTASHSTEDGADTLLDGIVRAVRRRLGAAERSEAPIALTGGEGARLVLGATRWSQSAAATSSIVRGAAISLSVEVAE